jgi:hypothetical protein
MDTYHYMQKLIPKNWMLVCGFGYRVTKSDITDLDIADLPASKDVLDKIKEACQKLWSNTYGIKLYWGDLDQEGEHVFQLLKKEYPHLNKWQPAYDAMEKRRKLITPVDGEVHQEFVLVNDLTFN